MVTRVSVRDGEASLATKFESGVAGGGGGMQMGEWGIGD